MKRFALVVCILVGLGVCAPRKDEAEDGPPLAKQPAAFEWKDRIKAVVPEGLSEREARDLLEDPNGCGGAALALIKAIEDNDPYGLFALMPAQGPGSLASYRQEDARAAGMTVTEFKEQVRADILRRRVTLFSCEFGYMDEIGKGDVFWIVGTDEQGKQLEVGFDHFRHPSRGCLGVFDLRLTSEGCRLIEGRRGSPAGNGNKTQDAE